jgi:PIN domain nuclease of toxin-antitoxin system
MILLDTHVVFWLALEPAKISKPAIAAIRQQRKAGQKPAISCISLYEISRISERGRIVLDIPLESFLDRVQSFFDIRPISTAIAMSAARLPTHYPGDPADRLIAATAIVEGLSLVTADRSIRRSRSVKTIW